MRSRSTAALAALMCVAAIGCDSSGTGPAGTVPSLPASTTSSASAAPTTTKTNEQADYSRLLLQPGDLSDDEDTFTEQSSAPSGPDGLPGASALFVNQDDTRAIGVTISILPDEAAAKAALDASLTAIGATVTGGPPAPSPVGTDGTVIVGTSPDGAKDVTALLFTEGPAVARLEFQSAPGDPTPPDVVTDIGIKQAIALRVGLPSVTG